MALLVTSVMLYLPANILPIMITDLLGDKMPSTILAGVILLWGEGSYPVAGVIFIASIMVPTLKMIAIAWLCWDAKGHGKRDSERMHLIYEVVEFVGRWSMIDVFVIAVLCTGADGRFDEYLSCDGGFNVCAGRDYDHVCGHDLRPSFIVGS